VGVEWDFRKARNCFRKDLGMVRKIRRVGWESWGGSLRGLVGKVLRSSG